MTTAEESFLATLVSAIEARDADALIRLYADDAHVLVVDPHHPPRRPMTLQGTQAVTAWIRDNCSLNITHHIVEQINAGDMIAFTDEGRYPDDAQVWSTSTATVQDGLITQQRVVLVWDDID